MEGEEICEREKKIYICCFLIEKGENKEGKIMGARGQEEYTIKKEKKRKEETDLIVPKTSVAYKYNYVIAIQSAQV